MKFDKGLRLRLETQLAREPRIDLEAAVAPHHERPRRRDFEQRRIGASGANQLLGKAEATSRKQRQNDGDDDPQRCKRCCDYASRRQPSHASAPSPHRRFICGVTGKTKGWRAFLPSNPFAFLPSSNLELRQIGMDAHEKPAAEVVVIGARYSHVSNRLDWRS